MLSLGSAGNILNIYIQVDTKTGQDKTRKTIKLSTVRLKQINTQFNTLFTSKNAAINNAQYKPKLQTPNHILNICIEVQPKSNIAIQTE